MLGKSVDLATNERLTEDGKVPDEVPNAWILSWRRWGRRTEYAREIGRIPCPPRNSRAMKELADKLSKLDAPGQDARKEKATEAMQKAANDMTAGRPQDAAVSSTFRLKDGHVTDILP